MCKHNPLCTSQEEQCQCKANTHSAFRSVQSPSTLPLFAFPPVTPVQLSDVQLFDLLRQQFDLVKRIAQQSNQCISTLATIAEHLEEGQEPETETDSVSPQSTTGPDSGADSVLVLLSPSSNYTHELRLCSDLSNPAYKDRAFSIEVELVALSSAQLQGSIEYVVQLFTTESPPKAIEKNTNGDKMIKGASEVEVQGSKVLFPKLVVKEVTSHYRHGFTFLTVSAKDCSAIKPLVLEKFVVKARKATSEAASKRVKIVEGEGKGRVEE